MDGKQDGPSLKSSCRLSDVFLGSWTWCLFWCERSGHIITVSRTDTCHTLLPPTLADGPHVLVWLFWDQIQTTMTEQTINLSCSSRAGSDASFLVFTQQKNPFNKKKPIVVDYFFLSPWTSISCGVISHNIDVFLQTSQKE